MTDSLRIVIPGEPHAQGRARFRAWRAKDGRQGVTAYDPAESRDWKATAQQHMIKALFDRCREPGGSAPIEQPSVMEGPIALNVVAFFSCPKSRHLKKGRRPECWHTKKPDGDNVLKAVKDAAKGVLWGDDSQVCVASITKLVAAQGEPPRLEILVRELLDRRKPLEVTHG